MNVFQTCENTSDTVVLSLRDQLHLKPIARLNISLQLPNVKKLGKSISHWEIMEKLRSMVKPEEFTILRVMKTTIEFIRFEAELQLQSKVERIVTKLDNKMIKLKDFSDLMRIRAAEAKSDFPTRRVWDAFFQEAKDMNEMKPGERPDTVHLSNLPTKWFVPYHLSHEEDLVPSEKLFYHIFEKFGHIRYVDIPISDPYRKKMKSHISGLITTSFENTEFFEGYVQFKDYIGFTKAMDALHNKKLVHVSDEGAVAVNIKVDFDKRKHLSDASIRRREIVRDRLVKKAQEQEERDKNMLEEKRRHEQIERQKETDLKVQKQLRRRLREEKRKAKIMQQLEISGTDEINEKIAREEKKLLKVQRKLEAIRLLEELFRRIKEKYEDDLDQPATSSTRNKHEFEKYKNTSELAFLTQREKLHHALKGRAMLKTILSDGKKTNTYSSSSSESSFSVEESERRNEKLPINNDVTNDVPNIPYEQNIYDNMYQLPHPALYYNPRSHPASYLMYSYRGRNFPRYPGPGPSRGFPNRRGRGFRNRGGFRGARNYYPPDIEEEYYNYFSKFLDRERHYNRSRSRSRSASYSRHNSRHSRSRSRSRSYSRTPYSRSRSRSKGRRDGSRSRSKSRSRSRTPRRRSRSYSRNKSQPRSTSHRSKSKRSNSSRDRKNSKCKSKQKHRSSTPRQKSVDSSEFISPEQLRAARSKSWSSPKDTRKNLERAWSQSPDKAKSND